jgi:PAS domain S-box-containing protein
MRVLSWNPAASRAFGYSAEEVVGRHLTGIMVASEAAEAQCLIERTVKGEIANAVETALTVKGGKKIRIAVSLSPLPDAAGNITAITAVVRDVSARHAADRRRAMEYRIVQLLAESRPIAETMPAVLASLCRSLKLDYGRYWQRDQDAELVQCESIHPKRGSTAQAMLTTTTHCVRRLADLRSETWSDGQPRCVRLSDSENDVRPSAGEGGAAIGVLLVPVTLDANTIAILEFAGDETSLAMPELLSIARVVGAQIGQYLQRRRAEDELRAEKEYIDHVIASAPALIACIMPDGTTRSVNQSIRDITQYSPEELDGRNFWDVLYAGGPYQQIERLLEAACAGGIADYPLTIRTRAGELRDLSVSAAARHSSDGSVAEYVLVCADVTSRRLGEARRATEYAVARALSEEQSEAEAIPRILRTVCAVLGWDCGIYRVFDPATRVVSCPHAWHNDAPGMAEFVETLSRPRVLQLGSLYWLTIDTQYPQWNNDVRSLVRGAELRVAAAGADLRAVISVPVQGGERPLGALQFFGRSSHKPEEVLIEAMQVIGHQIGQFVERKRIEVARQQTDERLRGIADNIPGIVFEYHLQPDGSARFEYVSERANDVLDVPAAELMNDPRAMFSLIDPGHRRKVLRSMQSSRRNLGLWSVETPIRTRGGQIKWVRGQSMPKQLDDGTVIWYGVIVDVTVQKQAENAIQHMNEQLERRVQERTAQLSTANRELESFAYSVSHDLRAPLRSIDGFSRILMEEHAGKLEPVAVDYLGRVVNASQRMGQLIDDLLALSQVTRSEVTRVRTNLSVIATGIIAELRMESPARNVDVSIHPDMICLADPNLVRIALSNLLGNAWKFTAKRDRASIELGMLSRRNQSVYYVRDNGAGFDMRHAEKLFGAFQRLHSPREFEGTGVGLATVSRIVERHGGRVWAESSVDLGATFYFTLAAGTERR